MALRDVTEAAEEAERDFICLTVGEPGAVAVLRRAEHQALSAEPLRDAADMAKMLKEPLL